MFTLRFALGGVVRLAEHSASCTTHLPSLSQILDGIEDGIPALEWVKDSDGTYLMSNGGPALLHDPDDPESNVVVHAEGWGPGTRQELGRIDEIGPDDFAEHLPLVGEGNGETLLDCIRHAHSQGAAWFLMHLQDDLITFEFGWPAGATDPLT